MSATGGDSRSKQSDMRYLFRVIGRIANDGLRCERARVERATRRGEPAQDGFQVAHKMVTFQWQDGKKVIVWPEELAPGKPRFPTPPWSQRQ